MQTASLSASPPPVRCERDIARAQARDWCARLPASVKGRLSDRAEKTVCDRWGFVSHTAAHRIVFEITDLFPFPSSVLLLNEVEKRMDKIDPSDGWTAIRLIKDLLENPDALLG